MSSKVLMLVDNLPNSNDKITILKDIRLCLLSTHRNVLIELVPNISFDVMFGCLQTEDKDQLSECSSVLGELLSVCDVTLLLHQFHRHLQQGLSHPSATVRELCLKQILVAAQSSPQQVSQFPDIVCQVVDSVGENNLDLAKLAIETLTLLGGYMESLECVFQGDAFHHLTIVMNKGDEVRYRAYEVVVKIAKLSVEALQVTSSSGFLQRLINEVQTDDVLLQLNSVELLRQLAETAHGLEYLDRSGVITSLGQMLHTSHSNPLSHFLMPGLLKFFGSIASIHPEEINGRLEMFIQTLFQQTEADDLSLRVIALETLGFVGHSPEGKKALYKQGNKMNVACKCLGDMMHSSPVELKERVYCAATELLHLKVSDQTEEILSMTETWYNSIASNPLLTIMTTLQQPMIQLRSCVLGFIRVMAEQPWGQRNLNNHPGFNEFILDRSTETCKEGKEDKYDIVKTLVESPTAMEIFGSVYFMKLREYHNEGPFYVKVESSVAFERE